MTAEQLKRECWVVTDGRAGIEAQALGLSEAVARRTPLRVVVKRIVVRPPFRSLPRAFWGDPFGRLSETGALLRPPYPDLWIGCGRLSVPLAIAVRERSPRTFTVQLQDPRAPARAFDLVIPPEHDGLAGENVFSIIGSPNRLVRARLEEDAKAFAPVVADLPHPRVAVLIGGPNKVYRFTEHRRREIAKTLRSLADEGAGVMITPSRRTEPETIAAIAEALHGAPHYLWDGRPAGSLENPYFAILGLADHVLVTTDSVNMAVDAAFTGRPVQFLALDRRPLASGDGKFRRFREALHARRIARDFTGKLRRWTYEPLDETVRAADEVVRRFDAHLAAATERA